MFQDALQSLLDWLSAVEPSLSTETAVMGDPETVQILIDNHKVMKHVWIRADFDLDYCFWQHTKQADKAMSLTEPILQ